MAQNQAGADHRPGELIFITLFLIFSVFLLSQLGAETKYSAKGQLFAQPRFWPAVGVLSMLGFGLAHMALNWRNRIGWSAVDVRTWIRAFEYLVWFMIYVAAVPYLGYLLSTILFTLLMALRQGYRHAGQLLAAALLGLAIVLVFKTGLSVKIPGGAIYEYLPDTLRNFMILNF
ncbi:MAG: tripartite tricarboxylate transporter TctB family protein [Pseudomonadota bacterium]